MATLISARASRSRQAVGGRAGGTMSISTTRRGAIWLNRPTPGRLERREADRQRGKPAEELGAQALDARGVDLVFRHRAQHLFDQDPALEPRDVCAEAHVLAVAEREDARRAPAEIEPVGVGKLALIAVGGAPEEEQPAASAQLPTVQLEVAGDRAAEHLRGHVEDRKLVEGVGNQRGGA